MGNFSFKTIILTALSAVMALCGQGCRPASADTRQSTPATSLYQNLQKIYTCGGTLLGHHDDTVYGHDWCGDSGRSDILAVTGDYPAMMSWDLGGLELGHKANLDGVPFDRMAAEVRRQHDRGGFNTFSWHLYSPVDSTDCWQIGDSLTVSRILDDPQVNKTFRQQVGALARFLGSLTDSAGNRIPVIFRPFHEHTGGWFWWGRPYTTPGQYKALWQIVTDEMDRAGLDNLLYAYSTDRVSTDEEYLEYYPGDDVIDILGADIYHFNGADGTDDFRRAADDALTVVTRIAAGHDKIPAFTETGSEGLPMADWWTDILMPVLAKHRVAYVVLWRNAHDKPGHFYVPYPSQQSEDSFRKFCNDSSILLINDLK